MVGWSSVNRLTGQRRRIASETAGRTPLGETLLEGRVRQRTPLLRVDEWGLGS